METDKNATIPPGVARRLKEAKAGFRLHVVILTIALFLMTLMIFLVGPAGFARGMVAFAVYLVIYVVLLSKLYDDWRKEKAALMGKKNAMSKAPSLSQPQITNSTTAPTKPINTVEQLEKEE